MFVVPSTIFWLDDFPAKKLMIFDVAYHDKVLYRSTCCKPSDQPRDAA
jgi:hypothetical protein